MKLLLFGCFASKPTTTPTSLATPVASVSGALYPGQDHLVGHSLAVFGQAQVAHQVDEASGKVHLAAKLAGSIVIGERVVIIVESLTCNVQETSGQHIILKQGNQ